MFPTHVSVGEPHPVPCPSTASLNPKLGADSCGDPRWSVRPGDAAAAWSPPPSCDPQTPQTQRARRGAHHLLPKPLLPESPSDSHQPCVPCRRDHVVRAPPSLTDSCPTRASTPRLLVLSDAMVARETNALVTRRRFERNFQLVAGGSRNGNKRPKLGCLRHHEPRDEGGPPLAPRWHEVSHLSPRQRPWWG